MSEEFTKYRPSGKFLERYAQLVNDKVIENNDNEKEEFQAGYKKGMLRSALAYKFLNLKDCGLSRYVEAINGSIWERKGDSIVRNDSDTSWIDELLQNEGNR